MHGDSFSIMFHPFCDWLEQFLVDHNQQAMTVYSQAELNDKK